MVRINIVRNGAAESRNRAIIISVFQDTPTRQIEHSQSQGRVPASHLQEPQPASHLHNISPWRHAILWCTLQPQSIGHASDDMASQRLADEALAGFAKGSLYDQHRPSYSSEGVEKLLAALRVSGASSALLLDLAAGTGKFTEVLARREEKFNVVAVEPHDRMRQELERKALSNVTVKNGLASSIPLQDERADAVIAAQVRSFQHATVIPPPATSSDPAMLVSLSTCALFLVSIPFAAYFFGHPASDPRTIPVNRQ